MVKGALYCRYMKLSQRLLALLASTIQFTFRSKTATQTFKKSQKASTSTTSPQSGPTNSLCGDNDDYGPYPLSTITTLQESIVIAVIGPSSIDKSSLIHSGFPSAMAHRSMKKIQGHDSNIRQHSVMLKLNNRTSLRHIMLLELDHNLENHDLATSVDAAVICYDVTQSQSMDGVPDLLNYCHSQHLLVYLFGLNPDLAAHRQLDFTLGQQLAHQNSVPFYEMVMDNASNIQHAFMKLIHQCVSPRLDNITVTANISDNSNTHNNLHNYAASPPESFSSCSSCCSVTAAVKTDYNDANAQSSIGATKDSDDFQHPVRGNNDEYNHHHHPHQTITTIPTFSSSSRPFVKPNTAAFESTLSVPSDDYRPSMGFAYIPTPAKTHGSVQVRHENPSSESLFSSTKISTDNFTNHQKEPKDSSQGLTVDDVIDRLISREMDDSDEQMIPIFITFFRKFMTPFELVQVLTKRFQDHMYMSVLPTSQQERIALVLISWMTDYWCDFYHQQTRHHLNLFLGQISIAINSAETNSATTRSQSMLSMQNIVDTLYNISSQPIPAHDPDSFWAKKDDNDEATEIGYDKEKMIHSSTLNNGSSHSHTIRSNKLDSHACTTKDHLLSTYDAQYVPSLQPSNQRHAVNPPRKSTTSVSFHQSTTAILPYSSHRRSNITQNTGLLQNHRHRPIFPTRSTNSITPKQKATQPHQANMTRPRFAGGTIQSGCLRMKFLTSSIPTSSKNLDQHKSSIYRQYQQTMKYSPMHPSSSSSSSSSSLSLPPRFFTLNSFRTSTPQPPQFLSSSSPLTLCSVHPTLSPSPTISAFLNQNYQNNSKSSFLHKWLLNTSVSPRPNIIFTSSTCTGSSEPSSVNSDLLFFKSNAKFILYISEHAMANQLTWIESELFGKIKPREFVRMIWSNPDTKSVRSKQQQTQTNDIASISSQGEMDRQLDKNDDIVAKSGLLDSISHFNFISAWVTSMVVIQPKLAKRVAILEKFMMIAVVLRDMNNYNTLMAILAGINNAAILRMKQTQNTIKKKKIYKKFRSLEILMRTDRSYCSYRLALKASTTCPSIPYLGIHSQDLLALAEANKDNKSDGTIHWEKFRLMGDCIMMVMKHQQPKHEIVPDQMILTWLADFSILTEEEQYQQSLQNEPRLKTSSMNHLRDLWFNI